MLWKSLTSALTNHEPIEFLVDIRVASRPIRPRLNRLVRDSPFQGLDAPHSNTSLSPTTIDFALDYRPLTSLTTNFNSQQLQTQIPPTTLHHDWT